MHTPVDTYDQRFSGIARLYGNDQLARLKHAHFVVVGLGGVGTWAAEALVRSGVGELTLIDLDDICVTNTNRQLHALSSTIGQPKTQVLATRLRDINPELTVHVVDDFIDLKNIPNLIHPDHDMVIDAIDKAHTKSGLIAYCLARKIGVVTVGSAGGKRDPRCVTSNDLARTENDPMFVKIRYDLYHRYRFSRDKKRRFRVEAVYSTEQMVYPKPDGSVCQQKPLTRDGVKLDCASGFGASTMVAGTFGFIAASRAIERYLVKRL